MSEPCKNILVVDNDPMILKLTGELLKEEGHTVTCVPDALGCLDALVEETPDIILIDLIMPGIPGDDLCKIIRNIDHLKNCYVIILSATAREQDIDAHLLGADACIAKGPFEEMKSLIKETILEAEQPRIHDVVPVIKGCQNLHYRKVTKELLDTSHHLRVILESMSQGILELTGRRVTYINSKASEILKIGKEQILGTEIAKSLPAVLYEQIASNTVPYNPTAPAINLNDLQIIVEQFLIPGNQQNSIVLLSDITERRKMESVIEAANLTKNLGYVFSGIRHEIGNPLNSIKIALSVLQRNLEEYDKETIAEFLDRSLQEVARLEYLLKALKNYSLFERPIMENVSVFTFISDFIALIRNDFESNHIRIHTIVDEDDLAIWVDSRALHHIMLNLITNAMDALEHVKNPQISISTNSNNGWVNIKIDDNGKGIKESDKRNLFQPFFTSKTTGTGLGLVIVQKMLAAMNGKISIESYQSIGTTVTVTLAQPKH